MKNKISKRILEAINSGKVKPKPRWHFLLKRWLFWTLAVLSTVLGGIAVGVIILLFFDHDLNPNIFLQLEDFKEMLIAIPYVWICSLGVFIYVVYYTVRNTKNGYRYPAWVIIGISLFISIVIGVLINTFDVAEHIQGYLVEKVPFYDALVYTTEDKWSQPEKGLLGGVLIEVDQRKELVTLKDFKGKIWHIKTSSLDNDSREILNMGAKVRLKGHMEAADQFSAEETFNWKN